MLSADITEPGHHDLVRSPFLQFPAHRVEAAQEALTKAHRRAVRAADRAGQERPGTPVLTVARAYIQSRCRACGHLWEGTGDCPAHTSCRATTKGCSRRELVDLELAAPRLHLAGWEFLATIEPVRGTRIARCIGCQTDIREEAWLEHACNDEARVQFQTLIEQLRSDKVLEGVTRIGEGNLVRRHPGAQVAEGELAAHRSGALVCDHCQTRRGRGETFVVRADGTAETPAGTIRQVGRNCLAAFLGGRSPESVVLSLSWEKIVKSAGETDEGSGGGGGGWDRTTDPLDFLTWTCACARVSGFVTRGQAREGGQSTASLVAHLTGPAPFDWHARATWQADREKYAPTTEDGTRAQATLTWARALPGNSDYEHNLRLVALRSMLVASRDGGILASALPAKERADGRELERRSNTTRREISRHEGTLGARLEAVVTVERCIALLSDDPHDQTPYGPTHLLAMRDDRGSALTWITGTRTYEVGTRIRIRGTVKRHKEYRGEALTQLTRCSVERVGAEVVAETLVVTRVKARKTRKAPKEPKVPAPVQEPAW